MLKYMELFITFIQEYINKNHIPILYNIFELGGNLCDNISL